MCAVRDPVVPAVGAVLPHLRLVLWLQRVLCDLRVVSWLELIGPIGMILSSLHAFTLA